MNVHSIQTRLVFWATIMVVVTSVGFRTETYYSMRHSLYSEIEARLSARLDHARRHLIPHIATLTPDQIALEIREDYLTVDTNRFVRVSKATGEVIYSTGKPADGSYDPQSISLPSITENGKITKRLEKTGHGQYLMVLASKESNGYGNYIIEMGAPTGQIDHVLRKLIIMLFLALPCVIILSIGSGLFLVRHVLRPVEAIRAQAQKITFGNIHERLPVTSNGDELDQLSITLNRMLQRLEIAYGQASRFSADASHELRTPLTIMRSDLEALELPPHNELLPLATRERIGSILEETERLSEIVESLFSIARLDAGEAQIQQEKCDLSLLTQTTIEQMRLLADEKNIAVSIDAPHTVFVKGDVGRLKQIIVNLFDNATKYTSQDGAIKLSVFSESSHAILQVEDNGIGIPADALPYIFKRFYRVEKARARNTSGAGLGLSIVQAICQAYGGSISIQSEEQQGTKVRVELPLTD